MLRLHFGAQPLPSSIGMGVALEKSLQSLMKSMVSSASNKRHDNEEEKATEGNLASRDKRAGSRAQSRVQSRALVRCRGFGHARPSDRSFSATSPSHNQRRAFAEKLVKRFAVWSGVGALIPLPLVDAAAVGGLQIQMLRRISQIYSIPFSDNAGKSIIASIAGTIFQQPAELELPVF